jgi:FkbM family methyltransferase
VDDLIFDIGMHTGQDTAFYLKKGFRVVGVEAHPELAAGVAQRLQDDVLADRLRIYDAAIADHEGEVTFYANDQKDDWGTTCPEFVARNESLGTRHRPLRVRCLPLAKLIRECGVPYYAKIDIEGADLLCLQAFLEFEARPRYLSIEASLTEFEAFFTELSHLWVLGYRQFKIVNQALNASARCPDPPREGRYVEQRFDGHMSGPFGEEAPGEWLDVEETLRRYRRIVDEQRRFGASGRYYRSPLRRLDRLVRRLRRAEPVGWYDLHGKLAE